MRARIAGFYDEDNVRILHRGRVTNEATDALARRASEHDDKNEVLMFSANLNALRLEAGGHAAAKVVHALQRVDERVADAEVVEAVGEGLVHVGVVAYRKVPGTV